MKIMKLIQGKQILRWVVFSILLFSLFMAPWQSAGAQDGGSAPPVETVKLIFIHHSCGENWLTDGHGDLGRTLGENNYFVSDTNYGWGPQSIGDRTDILDWPEWFVGPESSTIMQALFNESGQNSSYTRSTQDPGGENQVILFKSCYPNSELGGGPDDPPSDEDWLTVGSAKRVYNQLLTYFISHPDKLFVVITAPPVQETEYAANARAFNTWLVQDWLQENDYPYANVAVWDFYNVLTHPDNHHRYQDGSVDYVTNNGRNVLYYPDHGDTHPSPEGNRKATDEFPGMLNYFYNRWENEAGVDGVELEEPAEEQGGVENGGAGLIAGNVIDSFEGETPSGTNGWEAYYDPAAGSSLSCSMDAGGSYTGSQSLLITYDLGSGSWGTCGLMYEAEQDWGAAEGVSFAVEGGAGAEVNLDVYTGLDDGRASYVYRFTIPETGWSVFTVRWEQLHRVEWEADDIPFDPASISGMAFGFDGPEDGRLQGELRVDEISLGEGSTDAAVVSEGEAAAAAQGDELEESAAEAFPGEDGRTLCPLSIGMALLGILAAVWIWIQRR